MTKKQLYAHPGWKSCAFEGAEMSTLLQGLRSTFREKPEWLEAAETLALQLRARRQQARNGAGFDFVPGVMFARYWPHPKTTLDQPPKNKKGNGRFLMVTR